jgi:hypothetical protein
MGNLSNEETIMAFMKEFRMEFNALKNIRDVAYRYDTYSDIYILYVDLNIRSLKKQFVELYKIIYGSWDRKAQIVLNELRYKYFDNVMGNLKLKPRLIQ